MTSHSERSHYLVSESHGRLTRAVVDLDAIAHNVGSIKSFVGETAVMAVVKANAYGHGAIPVAQVAVSSGADWLGVYTVQEGIALRKAGIQCRILVFGPFLPLEIPAFSDFRLIPTLTTIESARLVHQSPGNRPIPVHVKVDTGLHRSGVSLGDARSLIMHIQRFPRLQLDGLYTHFACADEPDRRETDLQLAAFNQLARDLRSLNISFTVTHAANSAATLTRPDCHLGLVRCGIAIYGYVPSVAVHSPLQLRPALSWVSTVTRVHTVPAGEGVGYGHQFRTNKETSLALIPVGYGDGLPRCLGNGAGHILIRGQRVPIVGRVSMDQITVDVSAVPGVVPGDEATLIDAQPGATQNADRLAADAGTISYEILAGILPRVPRQYIRSGHSASPASSSGIHRAPTASA